MITLIDNYDSFTYNLYHCLSKHDDVLVIKNDLILKNFDKIINSKGVVISPGPSNPFNAGECLDLVHQIYSFMPVLGVCLGHQILGVYFGAQIDTLKIPMHGKVSDIKKINECKIYKNINMNFQATRYHSLYLNKDNFPKNLKITSISRALILGAPETVPAGKPAKRTSMGVKLFFNSPVTLLTICIT